MDLIRAYSWPGNVRQLENTIKRLTVTGQPRKSPRPRWKWCWATSPRSNR
jgi:two-component system, NtrC family, nitrogen regulation response regulator GlnG